MASHHVLDSRGKQALALKPLRATWERWVHEPTQKITLWHLQCTSHRLANATLQVENYLIHCTYMILEDLLSGLGKGGWKGCWVQENVLIHSSTTPKCPECWGAKHGEKGLLKKRSMCGHGRPSPSPWSQIPSCTLNSVRTQWMYHIS